MILTREPFAIIWRLPLPRLSSAKLRTRQTWRCGREHGEAYAGDFLSHFGQGQPESFGSACASFSRPECHLYFFRTFAQSRRSPLSFYFPARSINMDKRSTANRALRERRENRSEPRARAAAASQFTRHTMSSKFHPNPLKTNDGCTHKVTHFSQVGDGTLATNHQSLITNHGFLIDTPEIRNALKSNQSNAEIISIRHKAGGAVTAQAATRKPARANLLSSPEALRMARLMTSILDKRNFFEPSAPRWAFVFMGRKFHG